MLHGKNGIRDNLISKKFWKNKKVFVTGHTGFKGSWLCYLLHLLESKICGLALEPDTSPSLFNTLHLERKINHNICDIDDVDSVNKLLIEFQPEIVIHLAAQPLVSVSYADPIKTFKTNIFGTINLFDAIKKNGSSVKAVINVTSDKVYLNKEINAFCEDDPLGGNDPYSCSKACSDLISIAYAKSFLNKNGVNVATARSGNVIGGGDWALDRLIPDIFRSVETNSSVYIRNPKSIRPWQHVLEPISGYLLLAQLLYNNETEHFSSWNFGPRIEDCLRVSSVIEKLNSISKYKITWEQLPNEKFDEVNTLKLNSKKSISILGWRQKWSLTCALEKTVVWYESWIEKKDVSHLTKKQIFEYYETLLT